MKKKIGTALPGLSPARREFSPVIGKPRPFLPLRPEAMPAISLNAGCEKKVHAGQVDLVFVGPSDAERLKTQPGPHIRFCTMGKRKGRTRGPMIRVTSPEEALLVSRSYNVCLNGRSDEASKARCAEEATAGRGSFGLIKGERRKRR